MSKNVVPIPNMPVSATVRLLLSIDMLEACVAISKKMAHTESFLIFQGHGKKNAQLMANDTVIEVPSLLEACCRDEPSGFDIKSCDWVFGRFDGKPNLQGHQ